MKEDPDDSEWTTCEAVPVRRAEVRPVGADAHRPVDGGAGGGRGWRRPHDDRDVEAGRPRWGDRRVGGVTAGSTPDTAAENAELARLRGEVDRLQGAIVEQAIELAALRGKAAWG